MSTFRIPPVLRSSTGSNKHVSVSGTTLGESLDQLFSQYPALRTQILTADGDLNKYINIYVDDQDVRYLKGLETVITDGATITLLPAMAGGC